MHRPRRRKFLHLLFSRLESRCWSGPGWYGSTLKQVRPRVLRDLEHVRTDECLGGCLLAISARSCVGLRRQHAPHANLILRGLYLEEATALWVGRRSLRGCFAEAAYEDQRSGGCPPRQFVQVVVCAAIDHVVAVVGRERVRRRFAGWTIASTRGCQVDVVTAPVVDDSSCR